MRHDCKHYVMKTINGVAVQRKIFLVRVPLVEHTKYISIYPEPVMKLNIKKFYSMML